MKITGLDKLQKQLKQMERAAKELDGKHEVPFSELFSASFMRKHTNFQTFDELLDAGGFNVNSSEDLESIPDDVFDKHIAKVTRFKDWESMLGEATEEYVSRKLGF